MSRTKTAGLVLAGLFSLAMNSGAALAGSHELADPHEEDAHHSEAEGEHLVDTVYEENCASCHGADHGGYIAPALNAETLKGRSPTALKTIVMAGSFGTLMPPFYGRLSDDEIRTVVNHIQSSPKVLDPSWTINDMKKSLKVYVKDESDLPSKPSYKIDSMDDIIGVAARGKFGRGNASKAIFINSKTHR